MRLAKWSKGKFKKLGGNGEKGMPIDQARYTVIDTELTGLDMKKDSIVSIGAVKMVGSRIELKDSFYKLVSPEAELTGETVIIHGIMPSELDKEPGIDTVLPEFIDFCGNDIIAGFRPLIDMGFLNREAKRLYRSAMKNPVIDIFAIYKWIKWRSAEDCLSNLSLYDLAEDFSIPVKGAHNAIFDAFITAQILQRLLHLLLGLGAKSVDELLAIGNPSRGGDKFRSSALINNL
ncbi:MAG: 3'-5' exonuclease [Firmicutes bacterium]|nr:3'-5' exonuclease [Bacillota bacterium]